RVTFPPTPHALANLILAKTPRPTPWSGPEAPKRFGKEIARRSFALRLHSLRGWRTIKQFFCEEVAGLVANGILPNINAPPHSAVAATTEVFAQVRLIPQASPDQLAVAFDEITRELKSRGEVGPASTELRDRLANFLFSNWS